MISKISLHSPSILNIFGVGGFLFFVVFYYFFLFPFFYLCNYQLFSFFSMSENEKCQTQRNSFVLLPEEDLKKTIIDISSLRSVQLQYFVETSEKDILSLSINNSGKPMFVRVEWIQNLFYSGLTEDIDYKEIRYRSYILFFDKHTHSLFPKEIFFNISTSFGDKLDRNAIDFMKMRMDKINYDFQLELERWEGRCLQRNRKIVSDILSFLGKSKLPNSLKMDIALMFQNEKILLDLEDYIEELIYVIEELNSSFTQELDFFRKKFSELYKIKGKEKCEEGITALPSAYELLKRRSIPVSDELQVVLKTDIAVQKDLFEDYRVLNLKSYFRFLLLMDRFRNTILLDKKGNILEIKRRNDAKQELCNFNFSSFPLLNIFFLSVIFFLSLYGKKKWEIFCCFILGNLFFVMLFFILNMPLFFEGFLTVLYVSLLKMIRGRSYEK